MKFGDFLGAVVRDEEGRITEVDEARPGAKSHVAGDRRRDGHVDSLTRGDPPRRREGEVEVCKRLARALYRGSEKWSFEQREQADDVDCVILVDGSIAHELQVTQALSAPERWSELAREGALRDGAPCAEIAAELLDSVESKRGLYPDDQRARLTLVLDATRSPAAVLASVVEVARDMDALSRAGFAAVWVVGPLERTVFRLDAGS